ncbi:relaxase/mobilization nuclease domain-containing protein [Nocardia carnea]|uniref:relaxase/mobilization nuclease domain-containing protein n=1 Tax=Nocardia carnea TaxID=37328 RepID=UPI0002E88E40|nr:relaxase/mobilization nuclease domain-containing protein [Nocardia carnea]
MIPKITRGAEMGGLLAYLVGPGDENQHTNPHIVAGHASALGLGFDGELSVAQARAIAREIDAPRRAFGTQVLVPNYLRDAAGRTIIDADGRAVVNPLQPKRDGNVWHCSLSLHADEGQLPDEKWAAIAREFMDLMEFSGTRSGRADTRWVAIRHGLSARGNDHIHIAASGVREDGTRVNTYRDFAHAQTACKELEQRHDLRVVLGRHDGRTTQGYHRAQIYAAARAAGIARGEAKHAMRTATIEPDRDTVERIVRASLAASRNEAEFVRTLHSQGVLVRRARDPQTSEVRGWCVGLRPPRGGRGNSGRARPPILPAGGSIASDLTLPRLRNQWDDNPAERAAAEHAWQTAEDALARYLRGDESAIPVRPQTLPAPLRAAQLAQRDINASLAELQRWANTFTSIPAHDTAAFAAAARQASGVLSAWSLAYETKPGPIARAARTLSTYAQLPAHQDAPLPQWQRRNTANGWAVLLLASRQHANPALANVAVLHQIARTVDAITRAAFAAGDLARARQLTALSAGELTEIHRRFTTAGAATTPAPTRSTVAAPAAAAAVTGHGDVSDFDMPAGDIPEHRRRGNQRRDRTRDAGQPRFGWKRRPSEPATPDTDAVSSPRRRGNDTAAAKSTSTARPARDHQSAPLRQPPRTPDRNRNIDGRER